METEKKEIEIIDQIKDIEVSSGADLEIDLMEVSSLANQAKLITAPKTEDDFLQVKEIRQGLAKHRKTVSDFFMAARKGFNEKSKAIIQIEKDTLEIFTPEENRMKAFEKVEKERLIKEARKEVMPARMERLASIDGEIDLGEEWMGTLEEYVETLDDADFEIMVVKVQSDKNKADRLEIEAAKTKIAAEKDEAERIEKARQEERDLAAQALKVEKERLANEAKEIKERAEREAKEAKEAEERRLDAIRKEEAEKARIAKEEADRIQAEAQAKHDAELKRIADAKAKAEDAKYQEWLVSVGYNEDTKGDFKFITLHNGNVDAYKLVGSYNKP